MPKRDPDQPPPDACPLGEACRRHVRPDLVADLSAAEAARPSTTGVPRAAQAADRCLADGVARLRAGDWAAWGREGAPAGPWRRLPAEAWLLFGAPLDRFGRPRREDVWLGCVQVKGSDLRYYAIVVCPAAAQGRVPSVAKVRAALVQAEAEQAKPLKVREADAVARAMGAPRSLARAVLGELRRRADKRRTAQNRP